MAKIAAAGLAALCLVVVLFAAAAAGLASTVFGGGSNAQPSPSVSAVSDIPPDYLALYQTAASVCPGLDWSILAAIGKVETNHGRSGLPGVHDGVNSAGAAGVMQFLRPSFDAVIARHAIPPGGATPPSPYNSHDAIYAAGYYLCDSGANHGDLHSAIFSYNHAEWYVTEVLAQAQQYSETTSNISVACPTFQSIGQYKAQVFSSSTALAAVRFACAQLGRPYVWGGNGDPGYDCSGLTKAAYAAAGVTVPRVAQDQYNAGPRVPAGQPLQPGDLVFFGASTTSITHVGIAISSTDMIDAPDVGQFVSMVRIGAHIGVTRPGGSASR